MSLFFFNDTATTEIYTLSLHDALPILPIVGDVRGKGLMAGIECVINKASKDPLILDKAIRSEEHTSELQSLVNLVCRLLLEKKKQTY